MPGHDVETHCLSAVMPSFMSARLIRTDDALIIGILRRRQPVLQFRIVRAPNFNFSFFSNHRRAPPSIRAQRRLSS
jgi:hypothetical protein